MAAAKQMIKHTYHYTVEAVITMDDEWFKFIVDSALNHYDFTVKSAAKQGGFLYGIRNMRDFSGEKTQSFTSRQIGLMLKSIEFIQDPLAWKITTAFGNVLQGMGEEYNRLNKS